MLKHKLEGQRLRFGDEQRIRLAVKAMVLVLRKYYPTAQLRGFEDVVSHVWQDQYLLSPWRCSISHFQRVLDKLSYFVRMLFINSIHFMVELYVSSSLRLSSVCMSRRPSAIR